MGITTIAAPQTKLSRKLAKEGVIFCLPYFFCSTLILHEIYPLHYLQYFGDREKLKLKSLADRLFIKDNCFS